MHRSNRFLLAIASVAVLAVSLSPASAVGGPNGKKPHECKKQKGKKKCQESKPGRMTGQGTIDTATYGRSHHEFRNSVCGSDRFPDLKVQWLGNRFDLTSYSSPLRCVDTAADEGQPRAGFDTIIGQGTGTYNGQGGATASFSFTDAGEPGRNDTATITITDRDGNVVFQLNNEKIAVGGNHQAHRK